MRSTLSRLSAVIVVCVSGCVLIAAWFLMSGEPAVGLSRVWTAVFDPVADDTANLVIRDLRLPRLFLVLACGLALGLAGVILQDTLRNPIADPGLLGIGPAANWMVALSLLFPILGGALLPFLCLAAGVAVGAILVLVARSIRDPIRLALIGAVISMLCATLTAATLLVLPTNRATGLGQFFSFTVGSASTATWSRLSLVVPWLIVAVPLALLSGRALNLLQLGDDVAIGRGMKVTRARTLLLLCAALLVAPSVAAVGPVSFIALISPHVARAVLRTSNAHLVLPAAGVIGAAVLLLADAAGRLLFFPLEVPMGIWTIVVIGPAAIWMARHPVIRRKVTT